MMILCRKECFGKRSKPNKINNFHILCGMLNFSERKGFTYGSVVVKCRLPSWKLGKIVIVEE